MNREGEELPQKIALVHELTGHGAGVNHKGRADLPVGTSSFNHLAAVWGGVCPDCVWS